MLRVLLGKNNLPYNNAKDLRFFTEQVVQINALEAWARGLGRDDFPAQSTLLEEEFQKNRNLNSLIPRAYALAREAARRVLGERMFDVQLMGGIVLHQGRIAEMKTGEGKTLTSTSAAYLNSLSRDAVHIVTVNDYLAKRDALWMKPVFEYLGKSVGYIVSNMEKTLRADMYKKDIVYATNNELGFDYLRDNLRLEKDPIVQRGYHFCIIDEIDSILIDEARTPLIISGPSVDDTAKYKTSNSLVHFLHECSKDPATGLYPEEEEKLDGDYKLDEKSKNVSFTKVGIEKIQKVLQEKRIIQGSIEEIDNFEYIHYMTQSLRAHKLFHVDVEYIVKEGKVEIIDEFTGRVLSGRRYSDGLHQAIEAKEGIRIERQNKTLASITFQNFFRMYKKLSGMTGTAVTEEKEFVKIYGLDVVEIATNRPIIRDDMDDVIYVNEEAKINAIIEEVTELNKKGQPILLGTASIESSEKLSLVLKKHRIAHKVLNAKNHENEAHIIAEAGKKYAVTIATNMAGRGTDIKLGGNLDFRIQGRIHEELREEEKEKIREEEYSKWIDDYFEVLQLGGLYVIGTERHESRRIDNQLRGRSGRQGDSGASKFFLSLDDQLMRLFGGGINRMRSLMTKALDPNEPLSHPLITNTMERAQKNVENRNFEIRKHLLNFDEVLNTQKQTIYTQREEILRSDNLVQRLIDNIQDILNQVKKDLHKDEVLDQITQYLQDNFLLQVDRTHCQSFQDILDFISEDMHHKASFVGDELFNQIIRMEYLRAIDTAWQDHITQLEELRQSVYLRSYAQKNPLLEYKLESFDMFDEMIENISSYILKKFFTLNTDNIHIRDNTQQREMSLKHQEFSLLQQSRAASPSPQAHSASIPHTIQRNTEKVGRNELCPCGSGKKYKQCHGKLV